MKSMKKLAAVLLTAVMALSLLTACGGGGGGASNGFVDASDEFTKAINTKLTEGSSNIQVTYDVELSEKAYNVWVAYAKQLQAGKSDEEAKQNALTANSLSKDKYYIALYAEENPSAYGIQAAARSIAPQIAAQNEAGKKAKNIGYVTLVNKYKQPIGIFALVECE